MDSLRLFFQFLLGVIGRRCGFNHRLIQFCDRCGRTEWPSWWDASAEVWEAVAGNVNNCHHGCFCISCFTALAMQKGIMLRWTPIIEKGE